jgi:hypothetical protein
MSDLTNSEKRKFEQFLGMSSGYVLDFSNRTFKEFIFDSIGLNIYDSRYNYESGSKANRLRALWQKEDNRVVAKLMGDMLDASDNGKTSALFETCRAIVTRLTGQGEMPSPRGQADLAAEQLQRRRTAALSQLKDEFLLLAVENDRNRAGLTFEKLLNRLFEIFDLQPRQPFRIVGEQIDGSFQLDGHIYLMESKWEKHPLPEADLLVFRGKIEGKSTFTRGLFIALNDISQPAREAITRGKPPSFFVINGHDLMMILGEAISLPEFLRKRVRLLAEEGRVCVPFSDLR